MTEFPMQLVVPVGAVLAATITAIASFVSLVVSKEQKISEFREAWIDSLRSEIAVFASNARRVSTEEYPVDLKSISANFLDTLESRNEEILRPDQFSENRLQLAQAYYAIRLRLNPDEIDHTKILKSLDEVYAELSSNTSSDSFEETVEALDLLARRAQGALKREWSRVKEGEVSYRRVAITAKYLGIGLTLVLIGLVIFGVVSAI